MPSDTAYFHQVGESIKLIFDLTSRIDERVKSLVERQSEMDARLGRLIDSAGNTGTRLAVIESQPSSALDARIRALELQSQSLGLGQSTAEQRWHLILDACFKIIVTIVAGYLCLKLGLK